MLDVTREMSSVPQYPDITHTKNDNVHNSYCILHLQYPPVGSCSKWVDCLSNLKFSDCKVMDGKKWHCIDLSMIMGTFHCSWRERARQSIFSPWCSRGAERHTIATFLQSSSPLILMCTALLPWRSCAWAGLEWRPLPGPRAHVLYTATTDLDSASTECLVNKISTNYIDASV